MKNVMKYAVLIMVLVLTFGLVACDGSDINNGNSTVSSKDESTSSVDINSTITAPDFEIEGFGDEKTTFTHSAGGEDNTLEVYHKNDVIKSITLTAVAEVGDRTEAEVKELEKSMKNTYAEADAKDFISYSFTVSDGKIKVVLAAIDLDIKENMEYFASIGLFGITADSTYTEFEESLAETKFEKVK